MSTSLNRKEMTASLVSPPPAFTGFIMSRNGCVESSVAHPTPHSLSLSSLALFIPFILVTDRSAPGLLTILDSEHIHKSQWFTCIHTHTHTNIDTHALYMYMCIQYALYRYIISCRVIYGCWMEGSGKEKRDKKLYIYI